MNGAELMVSALENEGVRQIFGVPGEENLDVVEALRRSTIELVLTRHEQAAAFMAATHGRLTGKPGVCITTLGPGALNLTTGAAYALLGAMPMVMITGQKGILSRKQARFQVVDIVSAMTPLTKMARSDRQRRDHSDAWCGKRSASRSRSGRARFISNCRKTSPTRAGPDMAPIAAPSDRFADRVQRRARSGGGAHPRRRAAADHAGRRGEPAAARRCAVGVRAARAEFRSSIRRWARAPSPAARTSISAPRRCRSATTSIGAIDRADLIIAIGHDTVEKPPFIMGPNGPTVMHIGYLPGDGRGGILSAGRAHRRHRARA